jgi:colanic acid/amylovoran biosynthesis protein
LIGLNVSGLVYHGGYTRDNMFQLKLDYVGFVRLLVEQLLGDPSNRLVLVPHTFAPPGRVESDPSACRALQQALPLAIRNRVHLLLAEYDQHRIKGVIGMCDFFIGSRMHACIAALSQGIPTVGVAYSRNFAGVFETVGAAECVIDGRTEDEQDALASVQRLFARRRADAPTLRSNVAAAQVQLLRTFAGIVAADPAASDEAGEFLHSGANAAVASRDRNL